jgi:hypothetical protein
VISLTKLEELLNKLNNLLKTRPHNLKAKESLTKLLTLLSQVPTGLAIKSQV